MSLSTHVLDLATGQPAAGIPVTLERADARGTWEPVASHVTDTDGRVRDLLAGAAPVAGRHRLTFATGDRVPARGAAFFPEVGIVFEVTNPDEHHHVPLLLSPFGYSTYRGS